MSIVNVDLTNLEEIQKTQKTEKIVWNWFGFSLNLSALNWRLLWRICKTWKNSWNWLGFSAPERCQLWGNNPVRREIETLLSALNFEEFWRVFWRKKGKTTGKKYREIESWNVASFELSSFLKNCRTRKNCREIVTLEAFSWRVFYRFAEHGRNLVKLKRCQL